MSKFFVLDTNVLLHDSECIFKFKNNHVIIPIVCVEEIDKYKKTQDELGRNARQFSRYIDDMRKTGSLHHGVMLPYGGTLKVELFTSDVSALLPHEDMSIMDNRILAIAKSIQIHSQQETILVTKDTNLRIKADIYEIKAEDYTNDKVDVDDLYTGVGVITIDENLLGQVYANGKLDLTELSIDPPISNQCFVLQNINNPKQAALVIYNSIMKEFVLIPQDQKTLGMIPKNTEQKFALELLKDPNINLVSITGKAGSGKTILSIIAGLHGVMDTKLYNKVLLLKPIISMDNQHQLGFLPGTMGEKLAPWMASYADNIQVVMGGNKEEIPKKKIGKKQQEVDDEKSVGKLNPVMELIEHGFVELGSLEHLRGRSLPNQFIIIDETQNISPHAIKTVITRAGHGTKIVLLGDISQIDTPYLDSQSNGLTYTIERMKHEQITAHITLKKSERSLLAERAAELL